MPLSCLTCAASSCWSGTRIHVRACLNKAGAEERVHFRSARCCALSRYAFMSSRVVRPTKFTQSGQAIRLALGTLAPVTVPFYAGGFS
jgi:hypothetical protein